MKIKFRVQNSIIYVLVFLFHAILCFLFQNQLSAQSTAPDNADSLDNKPVTMTESKISVGSFYKNLDEKSSLGQYFSGVYNVFEDINIRTKGNFNNQKDTRLNNKSDSNNLSLIFDCTLHKSLNTACTVNNSLEHFTETSYTRRFTQTMDLTVGYKPFTQVKILQRIGGTKSCLENIKKDKKNVYPDKGTNRETETSFSKELLPGMALDLRFQDKNKVEKSEPISTRILSGNLKYAGKNLNLGFSGSENRLKQTYFLELSGAHERKKQTGDDLGAQLGYNLFDKSLKINFSTSYLSNQLDFLHNPDSNKKSDSKQIDATISYSMIDKINFQITMGNSRNKGTSFTRTGGPELKELVQENRNYVMNSELKLQVSKKMSINFKRNIKLARFDFPGDPGGSDRDNLFINTESVLIFEPSPGTRLNINFGMNKEQLVYLKSNRSVNNFDKLNYKLLPSITYKPFESWSVSHAFRISASYNKFIYDVDQSFITLNRNLTSEFLYAPGSNFSISLNHYVDVLKNGEYYMMDDKWFYNQRNYKFLHSAALGFKAKSNDGTSLGLNCSYQNRWNSYVESIEEYSRKKEFSVNASHPIGTNGTFTMWVTRIFRQNLQDSWQMELSINYEL